MQKRKDLTGLVCGKLTVTGYSHSKNGHSYWVCRCECGNTSVHRQDRFGAGDTNSCGCSKGHHGHTANGKRSRMYERWYSMIARCYHPNRKNYAHYGGKGIRVCDRWRYSFANFLKDMGDPPVDEFGKSFHLDRIDPSKDYCPENCRWLSAEENKRRAQKDRWAKTKSI